MPIGIVAVSKKRDWRMANQPVGRNKPELRKTNEYSPSQVPEPNKTKKRKKRKTDTKHLKTNARGRVDRTNLVQNCKPSSSDLSIYGLYGE